MTQVSEKVFLDKLYEVVAKLSSIAKTQAYRYNKIWNEYLLPFNDKPHMVRQIPLEEDKFLNDIDYRINVLKTVESSLVDGYYSIKSILETFYNSCFSSDKFKNDFSEGDQLLIKYIASREILGNLVQYNKMDHETVPLKYNIIAREYIMLKLKGLSLSDIHDSLKKLNKTLDDISLKNIMKEIAADGIVNIEQDGDFYTIKTELILSEEGVKKYNFTLRPLVDWPTQFWRSYYNIRELNVTPNQDVRHAEFLQKILSKSATQGFGPADFVFKNLIKYYEMIKADK